jgi:hypothetical protein
MSRRQLMFSRTARVAGSLDHAATSSGERPSAIASGDQPRRLRGQGPRVKSREVVWEFGADVVGEWLAAQAAMRSLTSLSFSSAGGVWVVMS